jgi:hypothetical protein
MKPVFTFLIQNGIPIALYINDGCIVGPWKERTIARYKFALDTLKKAGLTVSVEKSSAPEDASQRMKYLGVIIRTPESAITLTSVLAQEGPDDASRKIPNRRLFAAQFMMASVASDTTVAIYGLNGRLSNFVFTQALLPQEIGLSSVLREMSAIHKMLLSRGRTLKMMQPTTLWWLTDNSAVSQIFWKGSRDIVLIRQALQILELARHSGFKRGVG